MLTKSASVLACLAIIFTIGCTGSGEKVVAVSGTLTYDGRPVPGVRLIFTPNEGRPSIATTDDEGRFKPWYKDKQYGVRTGTVVVTVEQSDNVDTLLTPRVKDKSEAASLLKELGHGATVKTIEITKSIDDLAIELTKS